jgi:hypothetical protein
MARNGKIARLPRAVRSLLNSRLENGQDGKQILIWLNDLPAVRDVLQETFHGNPITEQNLSDWRLGGYEEWRVCQDLLAQAAELAAHRQDLEDAAPGQSPADILAAAVTFRYSAILAGQGPALDEQALAQLNALSRICQAVVQLRRSDQHAARQKIQTERWELEREKIRADKAQAMQDKIRAAMMARITSVMKMPETMQKLGGTPEAARIAAVLREIEICTDPAHWHSDILGNPVWDRKVEQLRKEMPPKQTELEAALDYYRKMEIGLGLRNDDPEKKPRRSRRHNRATTRVQPAESVPPDDNVHDIHDVQDVPEAPSAPTPAAQTAPAPDEALSLRPDEQPIRNAADPASSQSPDSPDPSTTPPPTESSPIVPNRA